MLPDVFSPGPKTDRRDLYDRGKELSQLFDALTGRYVLLDRLTGVAVRSMR
ncbi:MAG: hypothetical protein QXU87_11395 [Candidatus Caldarchaeum sp.]